MALFGRKRVKGISEYELEHEHVRSRIDSAFPNTSIGRKKRAILKTGLDSALDHDSNMHHSQKGVIQKEELENLVHGYKDSGVISDHEAEKVLRAAEEALED